MANDVLGRAFIEIHPKIASNFGVGVGLSAPLRKIGEQAGQALGAGVKQSASRSVDSAVTSAGSSAGRGLTTKMEQVGKQAGTGLGKGVKSTAEHGVTQAVNSSTSNAGRGLTGKMQAVGQKAGAALATALGRGAHGAEQSLNGVASGANKATSALSKTAKEADTASSHVNKVGDAAGHTAKGFSAARSTGSAAFSVISQNAGGTLGPITEIQEKMMGVGEAFENAGGKAHKMLVGTGAALTGIGIYTGQLASNDKAAMAGIQGAVEETGKSWDQYKEEMEKASKSGTKFGFTSEQTAKALAQLTRLTKDPEKALELLNATEDVAVAKHMKLDAAATKVGKAMMNGGKAAAALGINIDSATKADKAAEAADKAHEKAVDAYAKAQIKAQEAQDKYNSSAKHSVSQTISLNNANRAADDAYAKLQGTVSSAAAAHDRAKKAEEGSKDAASQLATVYGGQARIQTESFTGRMKTLGATVENTAAQFGAKFGHALTVAGPAMMGLGAIIQTGLVGKVGKGIGEFTRLSKTIDDVGTRGPTALGKLVTFVGGMPGKFAKLGSSLSSAASGIGNMARAASASAVANMRAMASSIASFAATAARTAWTGIAAGIRGIGAAMSFLSANPVFLVIAAIVALIAIFILAYKHFKPFHDLVNAIARTIGGALASAFNFLKRVVGDVVNFIKGHWQLAALLLGPIGIVILLFTKFRHDVVAIFEAVWNAIKKLTSVVWDGIKAYFRIWWTVVSTMIRVEINVIKTVITSVWHFIDNLWRVVWNGIKAFFQTIWNLLKLVVTTEINIIRTVITTVFNAIRTVITAVWNAIRAVTDAIWNGIRAAITAVINAIRSVVTSVFNAIKAVITGVWNGVRDVTVSIWNGIRNTIQSVVGAIEGFFRAAAGTIRSIWNGIVDIFKTPINIVIGAVNTFDRYVDDVTGAIGLGRPLPEKIPKLARGGDVFGEGTETSDSILGWLSHNEHVTNAKSAKRNRSWLHWMDKHPGEDLTKAMFGFASGGPIFKSGLPGFFPGGGVLSGLGHLAGDVLHPVIKVGRELAGDAIAAGLTPLKGLLNVLGDTGVGGWLHHGMDHIFDEVVNWVKGKQDTAHGQWTASQVANVGAGVGRWAGLVAKVLGYEGYPTTPDYVQHVLAQMTTESGGNPNITQGNIGDINNRTGNLARGLMQVIPPTFVANHWPGTSNNIFDPEANIAAALNYVRHRYHGDILGVLGHGHGYALGGPVANAAMAKFVGAFAGGGVVPQDGFAYVHGGEVVLPKFAVGGIPEDSPAFNPWTMGNRDPGALGQHFWNLALGQVYRSAVDMRRLGFGGTDAASIRRAQSALHVRVDGIIGPQTYAALERAVTTGFHTVVNSPSGVFTRQTSILMRLHDTLLRAQQNAVAATLRSGPGAGANLLGGAPFANPSGMTVTMKDASGNDQEVPLMYNAGNDATNQARASQLVGASAQYTAQLDAWHAGVAKTENITSQLNATQAKFNASRFSTAVVYARLLQEQRLHQNAAAAADIKRIAVMNQQSAAIQNTVQQLNFYKYIQDGVNSSILTASWSTAAYASIIRNQLADSLQTAYAPAVESIHQSLTTFGQQGSGIADIFSVQAGYGATSAAGATAVLQAKVNQMRTFVINLRQLAAQGVDPTLLAQIAAAGPDAGSSIATQLLNDPTVTTQIIALENQLSSIEGQGAAVIGNTAVARRAGGVVNGSGSNLVDPTGMFTSSIGGASLYVNGDLNVRSDTDIAKIGQSLYTLTANAQRALG